MRKKYQRKQRKSNQKFEVVGGQELLVRVPLPMAEVWAEMRAQVEQLTGQAGCRYFEPFWKTRSRVGWGHRIGPIPPPAVCAGESNRVTWFLVARRSRWNGRG